MKKCGILLFIVLIICSTSFVYAGENEASRTFGSVEANDSQYQLNRLMTYDEAIQDLCYRKGISVAEAIDIIGVERIYKNGSNKDGEIYLQETARTEFNTSPAC